MHRVAIAALMLLVSSAALADIDVGSDGSDGDLHITADTVIDLSKAESKDWNDAGDGDGVYDAAKWAVVFKFKSVTIDAGTTLKFTNHPSHAPVVFLSQGDIVIAGTINIDGANGHDYNKPVQLSEPGPGGFAGGRGYKSNTAIGSAGFGPGGGKISNHGYGGSYGGLSGDGGGQLYGSPRLVPLIGGSGGAGGTDYNNSGGAGGGAGGGAILMGSNRTIQLESTSSLFARGGNSGSANGYYGGGGSGGGVRLVCDSLDFKVGATIMAIGGSTASSYKGGNGRIRMEFNKLAREPQSTPAPSTEAPQPIWQDDNTPRVTAVSIGGVNVPVDPFGGTVYPYIDVVGVLNGNQEILMDLANIPSDAKVSVRLTPVSGQLQIENATYDNGIRWKASVNIATGVAAIQIRAELK